MTHTTELTPAFEELAAQAARAHGQSVDEHLTWLVTRTLLPQEASAPPHEEDDFLAMWEQEMDVRRASIEVPEG